VRRFRLTRRELLKSSLALPLLRTPNQRLEERPAYLGFLRDAPSRVVPIGDTDVSQVELTCDTSLSICKAAIFADDSLSVGYISFPPKRTMMCLFNWGDSPRTLTAQVTGDRPIVTDFWTGEPVPVRDGSIAFPDAPPHSARLLVSMHA
jgi:hypothetical protein